MEDKRFSYDDMSISKHCVSRMVPVIPPTLVYHFYVPLPMTDASQLLSFLEELALVRAFLKLWNIGDTSRLRLSFYPCMSFDNLYDSQNRNYHVQNVLETYFQYGAFSGPG